MRINEQHQTIAYLQDNTEQVFAELTASGAPVIITENGSPVFVLQDIASYERDQETFALLKLLAIGKQQIAAGKMSTAADVFAELDAEDEPKPD